MIQTQLEKPNILLICTDHLSGLCTQPGGHPTVMTPTLKQLSQSGTYFRNAYSACPSCIPARRTLMTGLSARSHGDRVYRGRQPMPDVKTMPMFFEDAGYQTYAVGKMHVTPDRDRIGFDEVVLEEQGRREDGTADDYELYLADKGFAGMEYASGMVQNDFMSRPWHLPEECHPINWAAREMSRAIYRRDPRKPGFWYLSFSSPHPPMTPLSDYLDMYKEIPNHDFNHGDWAKDPDTLPYPILERNVHMSAMVGAPKHEQMLARRAYYATITHIDHQIRMVIGTLREENLLDNTIIIFTSDHGHMVGEHGLWIMRPFYEMSAKIPMLVIPKKGDARIKIGSRDDRLVEFGDIMPTLLDLARLPIPTQCEGISLLGDKKREFLYGEHSENESAMRMIRWEDYKLIYYPSGNRFHLFNLADDPFENKDLSHKPGYEKVMDTMQALLVENAYGSDHRWIRNGKLTGLENKEFVPRDNRHLMGQRGLRFIRNIQKT